jgi:hypothetical protein
MRDIFILYMKTTILITEQQRRRLIIESINNEVNENIEENLNLFKRISKFSSNEFSNNLGFLITWGAGIGGFMSPVFDFLSGKYPNLSEKDVYLILLGVLGTVFMNGKDFISDVLKKIKENGLVNEFKTSLEKAKDLKSTFVSFLKSIDINVGSIMTMLSYAFMIPALGPIINFIQSGGVSYDEVKLLVSALGMSSLVTLSSKTLSEFFKKLIRRLK